MRDENNEIRGIKKIYAKSGWHQHPIHGQTDAVLSVASSQMLVFFASFYRIFVKKNLAAFLICLSTLIFPANHQSHDIDIKFEQISIEQGLSQSTAYCILQDQQGFIWVGTQDGLNRYDGNTFKVYKHEPRNPESLSHDYVLTNYEDSDGILWIGTGGGGLNKFDRKTGKFSNFKNKPGNTKTLSNNNVRAIHADKSRTLWIGTDEGLNKFDRNANKFSQYLIEERINSILQDKSGILWVGTDKGLYYYNQEKSKFIEVNCKKKPGEEDQIPQKIKVIYEDIDGVFWLGTDLGLFIREKDTSIHDMRNIAVNPEELKDKQISSIARDLTGNIWIGTQSNGIIIFDPKEKKLIPFCNKKNVPDSLSHNFVTSIYVDKDGLVWIGTYVGGINKFDPKRKKFNLYRNIPGDPTSLSKDDVMSICKGKDGIIWIGTLGKGFDQFNSKENKKKFYHFNIPFEVSNNPNRDQITAIFEDHNGIVWLGTKEAGLYGFNPKKKSFKHYKDKEHIKENADIVCIYEDGENVLWIGAMDGGLIRIDEDRKEFKCYKNEPGNRKSLSNDKVLSICDGSPGILWVGTAGGGLNKFDKESGQFTNFQPEPGKLDSLSHNFIISIYKDRDGTLWIGTKGGINRFDGKNETFTAYSIQDGLPSNVIYAILEDDDNNLWLSTNKGLSRFNPGSKEFRNYTIRDGLHGYEFNGRVAFKNDQGEMFFGGINGLNSFFPKEISDKERKTPPPVVITSFKKLGKEFKVDTSITHLHQLELSFQDDFISFEFAALSFSDPGKSQYAYKLEPVHNEWIHLGNKHDVDLINLAPGNYNLRVKGSNSDGFWNEEGTGIKITVTPPYWQNWWFYICLVLFVGGSISGFVGWRVNNIKKNNRLLQRVIDDRLKAEEKLRDSEELYRNLVDNSPDAIILSDIEGKIIMSNRQAESLVGYTAEEMSINVGFIYRLLSEDEREKALDLVESTLRKGVTRDVAFNLLTKYGIKVPVEIDILLIKDAEGMPKFFLEVARDISERKEAERKEKLHWENLIQSEKMASLGRLVTGVAHELNNPVASIKINSEIFDRVWKDIEPVLDKYYEEKRNFFMAGIPYRDAKPRLKDLIEGFMEGSQRIEKIINDLRDFSRPVDPFTREPIDINKVIESSVNLTNNIIKKATKHFNTDLAKNLPFIRGNFQKLGQVFINLVQNACQALPDNDKGISITSIYNKERNHVVITVRDWGEGIEKKNLKYITDPFFTTKRDKGGIGLGLSISMQIIQEHKGSMKFDSQVGKGTTVMVELPIDN